VHATQRCSDMVMLQCLPVQTSNQKCAHFVMCAAAAAGAAGVECECSVQPQCGQLEQAVSRSALHHRRDAVGEMLLLGAGMYRMCPVLDRVWMACCASKSTPNKLPTLPSPLATSPASAQGMLIAQLHVARQLQLFSKQPSVLRDLYRCCCCCCCTFRRWWS
jgi:hypothetical protein